MLLQVKCVTVVLVAVMLCLVTTLLFANKKDLKLQEGVLLSHPGSSFSIEEYGNKPSTIVRQDTARKAHRQMTVIILTKIRSGSTFFAFMMGAMPSSYLSIEPVRKKLDFRFPENETNEELLQHLVALSACRIDFDQIFSTHFMTDYCMPFYSTHKFFCNTPEFLSHMCRRATIHIMKIVSLRLSLLLRFVRENPDLNIKVVHLVRDPRATISSINVIDRFALKEKREKLTNSLCLDLKKDLATAVQWKEQFPYKYHMLRYEDLAMSPVTAMLDVLRFLDKNYTMEMFITHRRLTHTFNKENNDEFFEVNKYSKSHAFNWRSTMDFDDVEAVQQICGDVLHALKLRVFKNKIQYSNYSIDVRLDV